MEDTTRARPFQSIEQGTCELTETEVASTGLPWVATKSSAYALKLSVYYFYEFPECVKIELLILLPSLGALFLTLVCLIRL